MDRPLFDVRCRYCDAPLARTPRVGGAECAVVETHLRHDHGEPLREILDRGSVPMSVGALLDHVVVVPVAG